MVQGSYIAESHKMPPETFETTLAVLETPAFQERLDQIDTDLREFINLLKQEVALVRLVEIVLGLEEDNRFLEHYRRELAAVLAANSSNAKLTTEQKHSASDCYREICELQGTVKYILAEANSRLSSRDEY